jgi:outer membrane protein assembly factor BamB
MRRLLLPAVGLVLAATVALPASATAFPDRIDLPNGFAPEGIATGRGTAFYTGSLAGAGIWRGDYRTGQGDFLVGSGGPFVGMKVDAHNRLWVAGGPAGNGYVFDASSGELLESFTFATPPATFINDVVVTVDAAYFTDSMQPAIYRVPIGTGGAIGTPETIALDPVAIGFVDGAFNLNGIDATANGDTLIVVNSTAGALYAVDPTSGEVSPIDLGGASVSNGDGILLAGRTLYVVRNQLNLVAVIDLAPDLSSGAVVEQVAPDGVDVPTTVARFGSSLYLVNARFRPPGIPPPPEFWVTRIDR